MKRMIAFFLAFLMFFGNADWSVLQTFATESQEIEQGMLEYSAIVSEAETSAIAMSMYNLSDGNISLSDSNEVKWIDRIDLTDSECIRTFYDGLVEASDNDGINDYLIEDQYFSGAVGSDFIENNGNIYLIVDTVEGHVATKEEVSEMMNQVYQNYYFYIVAAGNAFDRDHPEVFWMTGSVAPGCLASYSGSAASGYNYTFYLTYLLKGNASGEAFDIRELNYQSQESIKNAINTVDAKVDILINNVSTFNDEQKLRYFNEWLTTHNEYSTGDLNNLDHECRECISALEGRTGALGPVCEAYARAFKVLCDEVEIPCVLVDGQAKNSDSSSGEAHMWNYVQLDDAWYGVDVTWNDPVGGNSGAVSGYENEKWLLVGSNTVIGNLSFINSHPVSNTVSTGGLSYTNGPELSSDAYEPTTATEIAAVNSVISKTYDGQPVVVSTEKDVDITWNSEGALTIDGYYADVDGANKLESAPTNAGTYYVKVTVEENGNYPEATAMIPIVIAKAARTIAISEEYQTSYTYNESVIKVPTEDKYTVTPAGIVEFSWYEGDYTRTSLDEAKLLESAPVDAGTYTLVATVAEDNNYAAAEEKVLVTINQTTGVISNIDYVVNGDYTYENLPPVPVRDNFSITGDGEVSFAWYKDSVSEKNKIAGSPTEGGIYILKVTLASGRNYTGDSLELEIFVASKGSVENRDYATEYTYSGTPIAAPSADDFETDSQGNMTFSWYEGDYTELPLDNQAVLDTEPTDAGIYTLVVEVAADSSYTAAETKICVTINPAQVIPSIIGNAEKTYDGGLAVEPGDLSVALNGICEADEGMVTAVAYYAYESANAREMVVVTATDIQLTGERAANYVLSSTTAQGEGKILAKNLQECVVELEKEEVYFTNEPIEITVMVKDGTTVLVEEQDYTVEYVDNTYAGIAKVTIQGTGNYKGNVEKTFTISYIEKPDFVPTAEIEKDGRYGSDVAISAEGYLVSDELSGEYVDSYVISEEGNPVEKTLYFKQIETGYITDKVTVNVVIDKTAPTIENLTAPAETEGTLQDISAQIGFTSDEKGTYCYIVKENNEAVPNEEDFITKADGQWSVNEGVASGAIVTDAKNIISINQLKQNTEYVVYIIAVDELGNVSEVEAQTFATLDSEEYTIYYELNGGNFEGDVVDSFTTHESVDLSQIIPVRYGYEFAGWYDENDTLVTEIPVGETTGKNLYAKWNINAEFKLKVSAYNMQIDSENNAVFEIPYNTEIEDWSVMHANAVIESNLDGFIIDEAYYKYDKEIENSDYSLKLTLYKVDEEGIENQIGDTIYNAYDFIVEEAGDYRLKVFYRHSGESIARELNTVDFTVKYAKREYPLADSIEIINIDSAQTFTDAYINEVVKTKLLENVVLSEKAGEEAFADGTLVIKNAKKKLVTAKTKVTSGTYTVTYQIGAHEQYLSTATTTLKIENYTSADVDYKVLREEETSEGVVFVAADSDSKGRAAGASVAYIPAGTENISIYTDHVLMIPKFNVPNALLDEEHEVNVKEFRELLGEAYTVEVAAKESSSKKLLNLSVEEDGNILVTANGKGTGKSTIVITTTVKSADKTLATITKKISNFVVAKGTAGAVKDIELKLKEKGADVSETLENGATRLLTKDTVDRYFDLTDTVVTGYDDDFNGTLTWKTSNKSIAAVTVAKDGTITLKIPKNAQGVAEITATAKDAGKKSVGFKVVIADKEVRLDTTSITMNSLKDETGIIYLYPNTLSMQLNENKITQIEVLDRVKKGKSYVYETSKVLMEDGYNEKTGELSLKFVGKQNKTKTHTIYLRVTQSITGVEELLISKEMKISVKDKWVWPSTSVKASKAYESMYSEGYAEALITTANTVVMTDGVPAITMADNQKFDIIDIKQNSSAQNGEITWRVKLEKNTESVLPKKKNSTTTQKVTFNVAYEDYLKNAPMAVSTKLTVSNKAPDMKLYGKDSYAPSFYTDADLRYIDVVLTIPDVIENQIAGSSFTVSEDKKFVECKDSEENVILKFALKDVSKFDIVKAYSIDKCGDVPAKKGSTNVEEAIVLTVKVLAAKTATLQFNVSGKQFGENTYASKALKLTKRTVSSETFSVKDANGNTVKTLTFSKNIAGTAMSGKESVVLNLIKPQRIDELVCSKSEKIASAIVEGADKNGKAMLSSKALIVVADGENVRITTTEKAFQYKSCKLKVKLLVEGETGTAYTKSSTLTLNFKTAQTPVIKLAAKGTLYKGFKEMLPEEIFDPSYVKVTASFSKMPVGYKISNVRFEDPADNEKYILSWNSSNEKELQIFQNYGQIASGKDTIGIIYDVRTVGGETISVKTSVSIKIAETAGFKSSVSSMNLYNSVEGEAYGKNVRFYDTKGKALKIIEIVNANDLQKAGIAYCIDNQGDGSESVKFYVKKDFSRGIEKTYTVKVKVGLVTGYEKDVYGEPIYDEALTSLSKTINVKINLKK